MYECLPLVRGGSQKLYADSKYIDMNPTRRDCITYTVPRILYQLHIATGYKKSEVQSCIIILYISGTQGRHLLLKSMVSWDHTTDHDVYRCSSLMYSYTIRLFRLLSGKLMITFYYIHNTLCLKHDHTN